MSAIVEAKNERPFFGPGWYPDLPDDEYHGSFGYSSSSLKILLEKSMSHLKCDQDNQTKSTLKGSVLHCAVLQPELFDSTYAIRPEGLKKPTAAQIGAKKPSASSIEQMNKWAEWLDVLGDREELTVDIYDQAMRMADKVREHPESGILLDEKVESVREHSVYYWYKPESWDENDDYKIMCKVRPDLGLIGHSIIFDLKSTRDAAFTPFMRQAKSLHYHLSGAMYLDGVNRCKPFLDHCGVFAFTDFVWIVVENSPPYEVNVFKMSDKDKQQGAAMYHQAVRKAHQYHVSDWQGYGQFDGEEIRPVVQISDF